MSRNTSSSKCRECKFFRSEFNRNSHTIQLSSHVIFARLLHDALMSWVTQQTIRSLQSWRFRFLLWRESHVVRMRLFRQESSDDFARKSLKSNLKKSKISNLKCNRHERILLTNLVKFHFVRDIDWYWRHDRDVEW